MRKLNNALVVLLPKKDGATDVRGFRPISLTHSFGKLFSKLLAIRLAPRLPQLVAPNQSAFVKGRSIQDNFKLVQLTMRALHVNRIPSLLLKVDITKVFDSVSFLIRILQHMGFGRLFIEWVCIVLASDSSKIVLNGVPGMTIPHRRGLWQGDPLSLMLFLLVMEVLNAFIWHAERMGLLSPLPCRGVRLRTSMYADDVVMFVSPTVRVLGLVRAVLHCFGSASGLQTNLGKCSISPIRCTDEHLACTSHSGVPVRCQGLPMHLSRIAVVLQEVAQGKPTARFG
jgi:hypothetical protein